MQKLRRAVLTILAVAGATFGTQAMATEEPAFTLVERQGAFEIRQYPPLVAAEVSVAGDQAEAGRAGFRLLAGYIFGGNTQRRSIAMTAPVLQSPPQGQKIAMTAPVSQTQQAGGWRVRFIMPSAYTLANLPAPNDPRVTLRPIPATRMAVLSFSGRAGPDDYARQVEALGALVAARHLTPSGPASLAQYNPPWIPGFMRRNEILLPVAAGDRP